MAKVNLSAIQAVSAGTVATLTGLKTYHDVDRVKMSWECFEQESPTESSHTENWMHSWERFSVEQADVLAAIKKEAKRFQMSRSKRYG